MAEISNACRILVGKPLGKTTTKTGRKWKGTIKMGGMEIRCVDVEW
jgi:hypothetical protein